MKDKSLKIEDLRELISEGKASDPLVFLESVMNGQDPRKGLSDVCQFAEDLNDFYGGPPDPDDWYELLELIRRHVKYQIVSLSQSHSAAKTLAEYLHAKRKHVETVDGGNGQREVPPLTKKEARGFLKLFLEEF